MAAAVQSIKGAGHGKLRALNCYIAFRSYYNVIFAFAEQKEASVLLSKLWRNENSRSAWALLAKTYSFIRDFQGKDNSPLDTYLDIACTELGITPPEQYCKVYGWHIQINADLGYVDLFLDGISTPKQAGLGKSGFDIIKKCVDEGFVGVEILKLYFPEMILSFDFAHDHQRYPEEIPVNSQTPLPAITPPEPAVVAHFASDNPVFEIEAYMNNPFSFIIPSVF